MGGGTVVDAEFVACYAHLSKRIEVVAFIANKIKRLHGGIARGGPGGNS